jgi:PHD/YefM family antitoxin component YafN of YafNO toxin-antitoxin module
MNMTTTTINTDTVVIVEKDNQPATVVMSYERYHQLLEELEDLQDSVLALQAKLEIATGSDTTRPWEEIKAELDDLRG